MIARRVVALREARNRRSCTSTAAVYPKKAMRTFNLEEPYSGRGSNDTMLPAEDNPTVQMIFCPFANTAR